MKLTYMYHSGFAVQGEHSCLIIDYFRDTDDQFIRQTISSYTGNIYVLVSHWHPDHFNPEILRWKEERPDIHYIFSQDILRKQLVDRADADFLLNGEVWTDDFVRIQAFGSTDVGISFLIDTEGKKIFHAGDLNNWHWNEESTDEEVAVSEHHFLKEVDLLRETTSYLDLAMFPVDPRLGKDYMLGAMQFVERIHIAVFSPMHFDEAYEKANAFRNYAEGMGVHFVEWTKRGESIDF